MSEPTGTPATSAPPSPLATPGPWNLVAAGYEEATRPYLARFSTVGLERLGIEPTHRLLDVACGPGTTTLLAAPRVLHVDGLDFSAAMLEQARRNVAAAGLANVTLHEGDGQNLPFAAESFDRAVSMFGLMFFPDRVRGLRELFRVLRPGGKVLVSSWAPLAESPLMNALFAAVRIFDPSRPAPQADIASLENPRVFEAELLAAGFTDVTVETVSQELEFTSAQDVWREMSKGSVPLVLLRRSVGETVWGEKEPLAIAAMAEAIGDRRALASVAHLAVGAKA
jgi:ubiquinone/menaquinone biosynthesis C-methylase UbiE